MSKTPEGFLVCKDVAITRVGSLQYLHSETPVARGDSDITVIERTSEDIFDQDTIRSFEGKSLTVEHPKTFINPSNWRTLTVGTLNNVRVGEGDQAGKLVTDLLITDIDAIKKVESRELREVSCGYDADYVQISPGRGRQTNIRGNHLALVPRGRAGPECAIFDSAPKGRPMSFKEKFLKAMGQAIDGMPDDDEDETVDGLKAKLALFKKKEEDANKAKDAAQAVADKATADLAAAVADKAKLTTDLATVNTELAALKKPAEKVTHDAAVLSAAEILAPGIAKDAADIKVQALKTAYASADGKTVIDALTGGKAPIYDNEMVVDMMFTAAAANVGAVRKAALAGGGKGTQTDDKKTVRVADMEVNDWAASFAAKSAAIHPIPKL